MPGERKRTFAYAVVGVVSVLALIVPAGAQADTCLGANEDVSRAELTPAAERTLLCLVNMHRQSKDVAPLALDPSLAKAAARHSKGMVVQDFFDHVNPNNGSTPQSRAQRVGYPGLVGENIVYTAMPATTQHIFDLWKNSEGHDQNMLAEGYAVAGMGLEVGWPDEEPGVPPVGLTGTQVFGLEPTPEATDTALDLVVSDQCAAAHADLVPFKADYEEAKAAQQGAAVRVAKKRKKLNGATTEAEIETAREQLKQAKRDLKEAKAATAAAAEALAGAVTKADTACE